MTKSIINILVGIVCTFFSIIVVSQNDSIKSFVINYIDINDLYPIRIDSVMFESMNYRRCEYILENDCLILFQNSLNELRSAEPEIKKIDIRRKIEISYYSGKIVELYIDRFHILYNGSIFIYEGELRNMIETIITNSLKR